VVPRAEQDRLFLQTDALVELLEDPLAHQPRLLGLIHAVIQHRPALGRPRGPQALGVSLPGLLHDCVREVQDRLDAPVVLFQCNNPRAGESLREIENVADGRRPEGVDRLGIVADDGDVLVSPPHARQDVRLDDVGVLVLVDQDVIEAPAHGVAHARCLAQQLPVQQQVVVIHHVVGPLAVDVAIEDLHEQFLGIGAPVEVPLEHVFQLVLRVDHPRVNGHECVLVGEPLDLLRDADFVADQAHHVRGVALVHDGESVWQPHGPAVDPQQAVGDGVKRPAPHPARNLQPGHVIGPRDHLRGRPPGEGQQQDALGRDASVQQLSNSRGQGAGFARARAGDNQQRPIPVSRRLTLLIVQTFKPRFGHTAPRLTLATKPG